MGTFRLKSLDLKARCQSNNVWQVKDHVSVSFYICPVSQVRYLKAYVDLISRNHGLFISKRKTKKNRKLRTKNKLLVVFLKANRRCSAMQFLKFSMMVLLRDCDWQSKQKITNWSSDIRISNRLSVAVRGNVSLSPFPYPSPHVLLVRSFVTNASLVRLLL